MKVILFCANLADPLIFGCSGDQELERHLVIPTKTIITPYNSDSAVHVCRPCLPQADSAFLAKRDNLELQFWRAFEKDFAKDVVYMYLVSNLDSVNEKQVLKTDSFWGPVEWSQVFEKGIE